MLVAQAARQPHVLPQSRKVLVVKRCLQVLSASLASPRQSVCTQSGCVLWLVARMGRQGRAVWWGGWCYTHELVIAPPTASTPMGKGVTSKNSYSCACETLTVRIVPCTAAPYLLLHQGGWACSAPCRENSGSWIGFLGFGSSLPQAHRL